jgi:predicted AlkP superfamily phosphohydrolase/phosphomutase
MSAKTLIIGWDGAAFSVLLPLVKQGVMPNLKALLDRGASGVLYSTIPPVTAPAWTSFATGVNPGKHSVVTWQRPVDRHTLTQRIVNSGDIQAPRFWEWLGEHKVGIVNLPMTYPPIPVNGFVVSGMLTPSSQSRYTAPPYLREHLDQIVNGYIIDVDIEGVSADKDNDDVLLALLDRIQEACRRRTMAAIQLAQELQPELYIVVFAVPDRVQHILWPYVANVPGVPKSVDVQSAVIETYHELDDSLGMLLSEIADQDTTIILMSDHGFCGQHSVAYMNGWLAAQGLLNYRKTMAMRGIVRRLFLAVGRKLPNRLLTRGRTAFSAEALIDWKHTRAFAAPTMDHGININLIGRNPFGIVEPEKEYDLLRQKLRQELLALRDPRTTKPIFERVYLREELYHGPYVDLAPDIVFELRSGYKAVPTPITDFRIEDVSQAGWGFHEREGILVLAGPTVIPRVQLEGVRIEDIAPTVLYLLNRPVPSFMDGQVLTEAFAADHIQQTPPTFTDWMPPHPANVQDSAYGTDEQSAVEARLRDLGYLA